MPLIIRNYRLESVMKVLFTLLTLSSVNLQMQYLEV